MPILWRYLILQYLKVLILCVLAFIAILLTLRLDEIAHFATLGPEGIYILYFTLYQIPYLLPIALPISALISSIILIQRLSQSQELTALRASGLALRDILSPLLLVSVFLAMADFYVVSELATNSHLATSVIKNELRSVNPLLLLSNKHLMKMKGIYYDTMGSSRMGESASEIVIAMPNKNNSRVNILIAENLEASTTNFKGEGVTLISSLKGDKGEDYDQLMLENIGQTTTSIKDFSQMIQKKVWTLNNDHLRMSLLKVRLRDDLETKEIAIAEGKPLSEIKQVQRSINRIYTELIRRFSIAIAVFTFTLLGASCGISVSRSRSSKGVIFVIVLGTLYIAAYFSAKGIDHLFVASTLFYIVPHILIVGVSFWMLRRAAKGVA